MGMVSMSHEASVCWIGYMIAVNGCFPAMLFNIFSSYNWPTSQQKTTFSSQMASSSSPTLEYPKLLFWLQKGNE